MKENVKIKTPFPNEDFKPNRPVINKPEEVRKNKKGKVANAEFVNARDAASLDSNVLDICRRGTDVEIIKEENGFYYCEVYKENKPIFYAYISKDYCEVE